MPLVRVSDHDIEGFDTFEYANMAENRGGRGGDINKNKSNNNNSVIFQSQTAGNWFSRRMGAMGSGGGGGSVGDRAGRSGPRHVPVSKDGYSNSDSMDDVISTESRSKRSDDENSVGSRGKGEGAASSSMGRRHASNAPMSLTERGSLSRNSFQSMNSMNSSLSRSTYGDSHHSHQPPIIYENGDELDHSYRDSRHRNDEYNNYANGSKWNRGVHHPEEDETSSSTMGESSQQHHHQQQSTYYQQQQQHLLNSSLRSDEGFGSADTTNKTTKTHNKKQSAPSNNSSETNPDSYVAQLEAQVAKLSFDLATTRSSLDEMQLGNRRLQSENKELSHKISSLEERNQELVNTIDSLEKEKLVLSMQRTTGVARSVADSDLSLGHHNHNGTSGYKTKTDMIGTYRVGVQANGGLEVPFRSATNYEDNEESYSEGYYSEGDKDDVSRGDSDVDSVALSHSGLDIHQQLQDLQLQQQQQQQQQQLAEQSASRSQKNSFMSFINGKNTSSKSMKDDDESSVVSVHAKDRIHLIQSSNLPANNAIQEEEEETEEYDEDDPFATCYPVPEEKASDNQRSWFQRGHKGGGKEKLNSRNSNRSSTGSNTSSSGRRRSSEEVGVDPFDTCSRTNGDGYYADRGGFADASERSGMSDKDRKGGLGLFRGRRGQQGRR